MEEIIAFQGCYSLKKISIPNTVERIDRLAFSGCYNLKEIAIPNSLTNMVEMSFSGCGITSATIPDGITSIRHHTFSRCPNLSSVVIPSSVKEIEYLAFYLCESLTSVTSLSPILPVIITDETYGNSAFEESGYTKATLHVPVGCKAAYEQAPYWKDFLNIMDDIQT